MPETLVPIRNALAEAYMGDTKLALPLFGSPATFDQRVIEMLMGLGQHVDVPASESITTEEIRLLLRLLGASHVDRVSGLNSLIALKNKVAILESYSVQKRIPLTGPNSLKLFGAISSDSSTEPSFSHGFVFYSNNNLAGISAHFAIQQSELISSARPVEFRLDDPEFGLWAALLSSPSAPMPQRIPVSLSSTMGKRYEITLDPPELFGDNASMGLVSIDDNGSFQILTYANLSSLFSASSLLEFRINFISPFSA